MHILIIDNYDSFTYNLEQFLGEMGLQLTVKRNDEITLAEVRELAPDGIVISPGPGTPDSAGISLEIIAQLGAEIPVLGVCLGHQSIAQVFGGKIVRAAELMHGKTSKIYHNSSGLFADLPNPLIATRYHSLIAEKASFPEILDVTAKTEDDTIMALKHKELPICGVQFHPESFLTEAGRSILGNFIEKYCKKEQPAKEANEHA
ncbi:MAG: aminodeoxychorismate/anthranilate synthase component II [Calditrichota bacterium]